MLEIVLDDNYIANYPTINEINIANEIKKSLNGDDSILLHFNFFTNENFKLNLLKSIRVLEVYNPIVFQANYDLLEKIKKDYSFIFLLSKGIKLIKINEKCNYFEKAEKNNLISFFKSEVDLITMRHELANQWGIERIKNILNEKEIKLEYNYELIKFLTPKINQSQKKLSLLNRKIEKLKTLNPKVIYYDDCADKWGPNLKNIFGENFHYYLPKETNKEQLFNAIEEKKPSTILLDLRLGNEKSFSPNVSEISGARILKDLKKRFYSIPVIMFTATNKAESVRELIRLGAQNVWTKEGIDNGIDDGYTIQNLINLIDEVKINHLELDLDIKRKIIEVESKTNLFEEIRLKNGYSNYSDIEKYKKIIGKIKKTHNTIVFDTNFFLDQENILKLTNFYMFLKANFILKLESNSIDIIIHNDVFRELFTKSQTGKTKEEIELSKFLVRFIYKIKKENLINDDLSFGQISSINELSVYKDIKIKRKSFFDNVIDRFNKKNDSFLFELKKKNESENITLDELKKLIENIKLHADDTFKKIIPELINNDKQVLFVTDDNGCAYNVGVTLKKIYGDIEIYANCTYNIKDENNPEIRIKKEGVCGLKDNRYCHKTISMFYNLMK